MAGRHPLDDAVRRAVVALAKEQAGVVRRRDLRALGVTDGQAATQVRRGLWTDVGHGCVAPAPAGLDHVLAAWQVAAAVLRRGGDPRDPRYVATGLVAARVLNLPVLSRDRTVRLVDRVGASWRTSGVELLPHERERRMGVWVTTPERTAIDLGRTLGLLDGVVTADAALRRGATVEGLHAAARRVAGFPGARTAARVAELARDTAESPLESIGRVQMVLLGVPEPEGQVDVDDTDGLIGRVDHCWRAQRVVAEADGRVKYDDPGEPDEARRLEAGRAALWAEKKREDRLRSVVEVFRYTWDEALHRPQVLKERADRAFALASHRWPVTSPPDLQLPGTA